MTLDITSQLTIPHIASFKEQLSSLLEREEPLVLNLASLEAIDVTGAQLLLALLATPDKSHPAVSLTNPNAVFLETIAGLGLEQLFPASPPEGEHP